MSARNKAVIEKVNAAFARGDTEGFLGFCTDDITWTMVGDETVKGKDAIRKWMSSMPGETPKFTVEYVVADSDIVMARGDMTMKDKDGKPASYAYCDVYRFRGDQIAELNAFVIKTEPKLATSGA
jgi:uncharacterized protein (TIGR02246 family)